MSSDSGDSTEFLEQSFSSSPSPSEGVGESSLGPTQPLLDFQSSIDLTEPSSETQSCAPIDLTEAPSHTSQDNLCTPIPSPVYQDSLSDAGSNEPDPNEIFQ